MITSSIKVAIIFSLTAIFSVAIYNLIMLFFGFVFANIIGEVLAIISLSLPFDASSVFGGIFTTIAGIGAFMVANKIYNLTSQFIQL